MSYRLRGDQSVGASLRRVAAEQLDRAIGELSDGRPDPHKTVHQVRKRCKKVRGLLRLVRGAFDHYAAENVSFRDAARQLSNLRNVTSVIQAYDRLVDRLSGKQKQDAFAPIRQRLVLLREKNNGDAFDMSDRLNAIHARMSEARRRVETWTVREEGFGAIRAGLERTYRRARREMRRTLEDPTVEHLHAWRKSVKYHWYQMRLLQGLRPKALKARRKDALRLSSVLGDDRDLTMLREVLLDDAEAFGSKEDVAALVALIDRRRKKLHDRAVPLGKRLFAEKPKRFSKGLARRWQTTHAPAPPPPVLAAAG